MRGFEYIQPDKLHDASATLNAAPDESLLYAGGTDVLGLMKEGVLAPQKLVNLKNVPNLNRVEYTPGKGLRIGALVTISEIARHPMIAEKYAVLHEAANEVASPQLRNVGTIGGNLCQRPRCWYFRGDFHCLRKGGDLCYAIDAENKYHCVIGGGPCFIVHPSDMAVALLALNARVSVFSKNNSRDIALRDFFVLPEDDVMHENVLQPGEIITEIHVPDVTPETRSGYLKFKERAVWDFAIISVAAVIKKSGNRIQSGRIAFGGVAPTPWQEREVNRSLQGLTTNDASLKDIAQRALKDAAPMSKNEYKIPLARNLTKRLLSRLAA